MALSALGKGGYLDLTLTSCPTLPLIPFMAEFDSNNGPLTPVATESGGDGVLLCPSYVIGPRGDLYLFNNCLGNDEWDEVIWGPWNNGADLVEAAMRMAPSPEFRRKAV